MWTRTPREVVAIIALFAMANAAFGLAWAAVLSGIGLLPLLLIGVFALAAALLGARGLGIAVPAILRWVGLPVIPRPVWVHGAGFGGWLRATFGSSHNWLSLLYWLLPGFVIAGATFTLLAVALGVVASTPTPWWLWRLPGGEPTWFLWSGALISGLPFELRVVLQAILGLVILAAIPFITRGLTWGHWGVARALLGAFRSEALTAELAGAEASRAAAITAEDRAIRRLERDIHDGPQQRLIRLQMDLASAERRLADDPAAARALIGSASEQAREALDELRAVSRGIAPPILLDRGLVAALESAAGRSPVPAGVAGSLPAGLVLRPELERNAYFIASEAMTNAVKHAGASRIDVRVEIEGHALRIEVTDDGHGGAASVPGHGLAGLEDRARGLGGALAVTSPAGGPTVVAVRLPLQDAAAGAMP